MNKDSLLLDACKEGAFELVKVLVEKGADIHVYEDQPLRNAVVSGHLPIVQYLVEKGSDIHAQDDNPLVLAAVNGRMTILQYLVQEGIYTKAKIYAVLLAAKWCNHNRTSVVEYLESVISSEQKTS